MKKIFLIPFVIFSMLATGCAMNMQTTGVKKYDNYHPVKKIALLPAASEKKFAAERMNKINLQAMEASEKDGYVVIRLDQIKKVLGSSYQTLENNPTDKKLLRKLSRKFKLDAFIQCQVIDWQADIPVRDKEGTFLNKVSLKYTAIDAKTLKPLSENSGMNEDTGALSEESVVAALAKDLAVKLIKSL